MSKVEGMNILEEHECPLNQQPGEEGMDMMDIHIVKVEGMSMVEEHQRSSKAWPEVEGVNMVKNMTTEVDVEVDEKEHVCVVLVKHWISDGVEMHRWTHHKWELAKLGCWKGHTTFASPDSNYSILRRVEKSEEESANERNVCWMSSNGGRYL
jgi:hypothetical protein